MMTKLLDWIGDWNPQLFRELKGRFTQRNVAIAVGASLLAQLMIVLKHIGFLEVSDNQFSRYCTGGTYYPVAECLRPSPAEDWLRNWQSWNFDLFTTLTLIGGGILLVVGSYLINADLAKEERRDTLGFLRLSPQAVQNIILGKILGVPSLIYLGVGLALPLHFFVGLRAHISIPWIAMVYLMAIAACFTCFSVAVLWSLIGQKFFSGFQAWLYSGTIGYYLLAMTVFGISFPIDSNLPSYSDTPANWLRMLYPGNIFYYLVQQNSLPDEWLYYFSPSHWFDIEFYGSTHWSTGLLGLGFLLGHYAFISFIAWRGISRRFYNPNTPVVSKTMGYGTAIIVSILITGFVAVEHNYSDYKNQAYEAFSDFEALQILNFVLIVGLTLLMTPARQQVQDWVRTRHQGRFSRRLWADLLWGDRSPPLVVIALMIISTASIMAIAAMSNPFLEDKTTVISALILQCGISFLLASAIQRILLRKKRREIWLMAIVGSVTVLPVIISVVLDNIFFGGSIYLFPISFMSVVQQYTFNMFIGSLVGQFIAVVGSIFILQKQIRRLGDSEVETLLPTAAESPENMLT